jgi:putative nucleotidyltransferase with HDIG domain
LTNFPHNASVLWRRPGPLEAYLLALGLVAGALFSGLLVGGAELGTPWVVAVLCVAAAVADRGTVRLSKTTEISVALLPGLFAAIVFGPLAAMLVASASMLTDLRPQPQTERPYLKWAIYTLSRSTTGGIAGLAAAVAFNATDNRIGGILAATAAAAIVAASVDILFASITMRLRGVAGLLEAARAFGPIVASSVPLYTPVLALLAFAYMEISPWTLPLFFVPAFAAQRLFILYQDQLRLTGDLVTVNQRLEQANLSFATALVATLDARDRYTAGHSAAVAIYARDIAARMGLSEDEQQLAHVCGLVHDIGKIGLPAGLLEKGGPMSLEERRLMEEHSVIGERILAKVEDYAEIARIVRHHHERWDGQGYPDGLAESDVPLISRIISVADAYNAMTSDRPYRDAMPSRVARLRLAQAVESQFDTAVVAAFEAILAGASETYRRGDREDFRFEVQEALPAASAAAG